jgi:hypothetical protein
MYHLIKNLPEGILIYDVINKRVSRANIGILNLLAKGGS